MSLKNVLSVNRLTLYLGDAAVVRPHLDKFFLDRIEVVRTFPERTFHDLVTLTRLATWGLGPTPIAENLSHEELTRRSKCSSIISALLSFFILLYFFY